MPIKREKADAAPAANGMKIGAVDAEEECTIGKSKKSRIVIEDDEFSDSLRQENLAKFNFPCIFRPRLDLCRTLARRRG